MDARQGSATRLRVGARLDDVSWAWAETRVQPPSRRVAVASSAWEVLVLLGSEGVGRTWRMEALWRSVRVVLARHAAEHELYLWLVKTPGPMAVPRSAMVFPNSPLFAGDDGKARSAACSQAIEALKGLRVDHLEITRMIAEVTGPLAWER